MDCLSSQTVLSIQDRRWRLRVAGDGDGVQLRASYRADDGGRLNVVLRHLELCDTEGTALRLMATVRTVVELGAARGSTADDDLVRAGRELLAQVLGGRIDAVTPAPSRRPRRALCPHERRPA